MIGLWNVNWLNQNSQRAYPLAQQATRECALSPEIRLPDDALLALRLCVNTGHEVDTERFFVRSLTVTGTGFTFTVGYLDAEGEAHDVALTHVPQNTEQTTFILTGLGDFHDLAGYVAVDTRGGLAQMGAGYYPFTYAATMLEPDCVVPMLRSVSSVQVWSNGSLGEPIYGDIQLVAGANILITPSVVNGITTLTIHARCADPGYDAPCECDEAAALPCIRTINGVYPDTTGNITIEGVDCISLTNASNTIYVSDTCATPHCGCEEITALAETIKKLESAASTFDNLLQSLHAEVTQTAALTAGTCFDVRNVRPEGADA